MIVSGEDKEVQFYKGIQFKHEKSFSKAHSGFITKCGFNPWDKGATFLTTSQDKTLKVFSGESYEQVFEQTGIHSMGVNDFTFTNAENELFTCSSDRTVK